MFNRWKLLAGLVLAASGAAASPNELVVDGIQVELGVVTAAQLRGYPRESIEGSMHGGVPKSDNYCHANVSLFNAKTHAPIANASVEGELVQAGSPVVRKTLEPMTVNGGRSYGNYFPLMSRLPYEFRVLVHEAGSTHVTEAKFRGQAD